MKIPSKPFLPDNNGKNDKLVSKKGLRPKSESKNKTLRNVKIASESNPICKVYPDIDKIKSKALKARKVHHPNFLKKIITQLILWLSRDFYMHHTFKESKYKMAKKLVESAKREDDQYELYFDKTTNKRVPASVGMWRDLSRASYHFIGVDGSSWSFNLNNYTHFGPQGTLLEQQLFQKEGKLKNGKVPLAPLFTQAVKDWSKQALKSDQEEALLAKAVKIAQQEIFAIAMVELNSKGKYKQPVAGEAKDYTHNANYTFCVEDGSLKLYAENVDKHFGILANPETDEMLDVVPETSEFSYKIILSFKLREKGGVQITLDHAQASLSYDLVV